MLLRRRLRYWVYLMQLSRMGNLILLGTSIYLAAIFLVAPATPYLGKLLSLKLLCSAIATACITAGGYILNDYFDVQIDGINRPASRIVGREVSRRRALMWHMVLTATGLLFSLAGGLKMVGLSVVAAGALGAYSAWLKRAPVWGNLAVAFLSAVVLLVPWLVFGHSTRGLWVFVVFSFTISLIREIIKDCEDMRGDAAFGCRTLPIIWGLSNTRVFVGWLMVVFVALTVGLSYMLTRPLLIYNATLVFPVGLFLLRLPQADTRRQFKDLSLICKMIMAQGILGMLLA
jgi:4-hydroxybenzoate polyprenyltransferase